MHERIYRLTAAVNGFLPLPASGRMNVIIPRGSLLRVTPDPYDPSGSLLVHYAGKSCRLDVDVINGLENTPPLLTEGLN